MSELEKRLNPVRRAAIEGILRERVVQADRWHASDLNKNAQDWVSVLAIYLGKAAQETPLYADGAVGCDRFKKRVEQIAAVCLAILETT